MPVVTEGRTPTHRDGTSPPTNTGTFPRRRQSATSTSQLPAQATRQLACAFIGWGAADRTPASRRCRNWGQQRAPLWCWPGPERRLRQSGPNALNEPPDTAQHMSYQDHHARLSHLQFAVTASVRAEPRNGECGSTGESSSFLPGSVPGRPCRHRHNSPNAPLW